MRHGGFFWGILLVLFGSLLLAANFGLLPKNFNVWGLFWPLILILLGVGGVLSAVKWREGDMRGAETLALDLKDARQARVRFYHGAGELTLDGHASPGKLIEGRFAGGVKSDERRSGDGLDVDLRVPESAWSTFMPFGSQPLNWEVGLSRDVPLSIELESGASRNNLDLTNLQVKDFRLSSGASSTDVMFPAQAGETRAWVRTGAASFTGRIPQGVAARIKVSGAIHGVTINTSRFSLAGSIYQSPDYNGASNRVDLDIEIGVGSVTIL